MNMNIIIGLPLTRRQHGLIWVIVDHMTKLEYFLRVNTIDLVEDCVRLYLGGLMKLHGFSFTTILEKGTHFTS